MIENVDHIIIAVEDLKSAEDNYTKIFGIEPVWRGFHNELGTSNVILILKIHIWSCLQQLDLVLVLTW